MINTDRVIHEIDPVWNRDSRILVLGSFPSVKSREGKFFYHHPQNRFWKVLAAVFGAPLPASIEEKKQLLLENGVALWDVIASCQIQGSSDSSIRDVVPNDLSRILSEAPIENIFANGNTAYRLYVRYSQPFTKRQAIRLPSTSPANAAWSLERLIEAWKVIRIP